MTLNLLSPTFPFLCKYIFICGGVLESFMIIDIIIFKFKVYYLTEKMWVQLELYPFMCSPTGCYTN